MSSEFGGVEVLCRHLGMVYEVDGESVVALDDVNLTLAPGDQLAVVGPSGSGKSTLTTLLAGLRRPTRGNILVGTDDLATLSETELLRLRSRRIGIVLQNPSRSLLPYGTAEDNIRFAQRAVARKHRSTLPDPGELLDQLGLGALRGARAGGLSGGEQQRLAVAVGMANAPSLLLADEPTSQLDHRSRDVVVSLLDRVTRQFETTTIVVTHDQEVADAMQRAVTMHEGRLVSDVKRSDVKLSDVGSSGADEPVSVPTADAPLSASSASGEVDDLAPPDGPPVEATEHAEHSSTSGPADDRTRRDDSTAPGERTPDDVGDDVGDRRDTGDDPDEYRAWRR